MNKSAIKSFATEARLELLEKIQLQARKLGITPDAIQHASLESSDAIFIDGKLLSDVERKQRNKLITRVNEIGYDRVMEEAAYTWFNRFIALRYMEVNDYLPTKVRVLSSVNPDSTEPDMFKEALNLDLPIDKELVYNLKIENKTDELFKYLIKVHCNDLNRYMPFMFENVEGYTEVLYPEGLLGTDTFVRKMTDIGNIPEKDWTKVEIVGWLYQYYISEENERIIKAKKRYNLEEIPYATQLFTPEWIVRYMVQNALGRYWVESHPEHLDLISNWDFYLEDKNQEQSFEIQLAPYINKELNVEDIKCIDPAMGSGHILIYMFDLLYEIYNKCGYMEREIPRLIIEKNLYGLDIDERAYQLACFSVVMKAVQYNKRFLRSIQTTGLQLNLAVIKETNQLTEEQMSFLLGDDKSIEYEKNKEWILQFQNSSIIGSLLNISNSSYTFFEKRFNELNNYDGNLFEEQNKEVVLPLLQRLLKQAQILSNKYDIAITNPPYAGRSYLPHVLVNYLDEHYKEGKSDLFAAFILRIKDFVNSNGQIGLMTPFVWMFLSSYESLRNLILDTGAISSLVQLEYSAFEGATVPICTFTLRNYNANVSGEYIKLSDFAGAENQPLKVIESINNKVSYRYSIKPEKYKQIPGSPFAYWIDDKTLDIFNNNPSLGEVVEAKVGLQTSNNNRFLRYWYEVDFNKIDFICNSIEEAAKSKAKWFPCNKGGGYRKWYGNREFVVNWECDGLEIKEYAAKLYKSYSRTVKNIPFYFKESVSWSDITSSNNSFRYYESGFIFDATGHSAFPNEQIQVHDLLAVLNNKFFNSILKMLNPTLHFHVGYFNKLPAVFINKDEAKRIVEENILISKVDWDSNETSWDFRRHPYLNYNSSSIKEISNLYNRDLLDKINKLKKNEETLNKLFIDKYGLGDVLNPYVDESLITLKNIDLIRDIKSLISFIIGCLFSRYSTENSNKMASCLNDNISDNIIPILKQSYLENEMSIQFIEYLTVMFSQETLEENLNFIADVLGRKKNETSREVLRRYFLMEFYKDHLQMYQKRPIYWLFTSGKEKAFNCLIYMHRYDKTTLSRIRTEYVHEVQNRMDAEKNDLLNIINGDSTVKEIATAKKELKSLEKKIDELKKYDELLHHMADQQIEIDLDDGVKHNYELFKGLVAPIK